MFLHVFAIPTFLTLCCAVFVAGSLSWTYSQNYALWHSTVILYHPPSVMVHHRIPFPNHPFRATWSLQHPRFHPWAVAGGRDWEATRGQGGVATPKTFRETWHQRGMEWISANDVGMLPQEMVDPISQSIGSLPRLYECQVAQGFRGVFLSNIQNMTSCWRTASAEYKRIGFCGRHLAEDISYCSTKESLLADDELHLHRGMWAPTVQLPR